MNKILFCYRIEVLYGIYGDRAAVRVGDFKLIMGESYVPFSPRPLAKGELDNLMKPVTIWDSELECANYPDAIGCWPDISPCLFNVRFDPYSLNRYNGTAIYRSKRDLEDMQNEYMQTPAFKQTLEKLKESKRRLKRENIQER